MGSSDGRVDVSVVVPSVNGLPYPMECLEALTRQDGGVRSEIIVADCTGPETVAAVRERFPHVRVLAFDEPRSVPWLRSSGIEAATGRLVAVTEDHCVPHDDWLARLVEAHRATGWAAVGGGVENAATERVVDWAVFFCEYSRHLSPVAFGPNEFVPGMNVAYDMDALGGVRDAFLQGLWEPFVHERIRAAGGVTGLDPSVVVGHKKRFTVRMFASERFHYSRSFAGMRVRGAGLARRMAWAASSLLLPPLLVARVTRNVVHSRTHLGWFVRSLPLIAAFSVVWSAGELVGYLLGPGDSLLRVR